MPIIFKFIFIVEEKHICLSNCTLTSGIFDDYFFDFLNYLYLAGGRPFFFFSRFTTIIQNNVGQYFDLPFWL